MYKLCFGPKSFIAVADPIMARHILRDNAKAYDKGVLAEILEPIMGKGLIPADPETWSVRRRAIVPGFHKAWLEAMVRGEGGGGLPIRRSPAALMNGVFLETRCRSWAVCRSLLGVDHGDPTPSLLSSVGSFSLRGSGPERDGHVLWWEPLLHREIPHPSTCVARPKLARNTCP